MRLNMALLNSALQGVMLSLTIGMSIAVANGTWGLISPTGSTLNEWIDTTFNMSKTVGA
jgi:hypothetical protein